MARQLKPRIVIRAEFYRCSFGFYRRVARDSRLSICLKWLPAGRTFFPEGERLSPRDTQRNVAQQSRLSSFHFVNPENSTSNFEIIPSISAFSATLERRVARLFANQNGGRKARVSAFMCSNIYFHVFWQCIFRPENHHLCLIIIFIYFI